MKNQFPVSWPIVPFKRVAKVITGTTPPTQNSEYYGDSVLFVGPKELGRTEPITHSSKWLSFKGAEQARVLPPESVLVCCIGATIGKVVGFSGTELATNQQINALVFNKSIVHPRYAFHYCRILEPLIRHMGASTTLPLLLKGRFQDIEIPIPSLEEQNRIAAILDRADAVLRKRQEAIALTEELLRSTFLEMFGDPITNPKGWKQVPLEILLTDIQSGWSPECDAREAEAEEWAVLKLGAVTQGHFDPTQNKALLPDASPRPDLEVKAGDLLVTRKNTYELVGASAFVHSTRTKLMIPDLIFRLCLTKEVDSVYLWQALSQRSMRLQLSKLASGTSGSMPNISKARLQTLLVPLPPLKNQIKYREFVQQFWKQQKQQKINFQFTDNLFNSLLQKSFRGEL